MKKLRFINKYSSENKKDAGSSTEEVSNPISDSIDKKKVQSEYHEILNTGKSFSYSYLDALQFRDVEGIESNIDMLNYRSKKHLDSDVERRIDQALLEKSPIITRKQANVLYVVSKPTPGQIHGDWAVRSHGQIYSHHRTKKNAVKKARELASNSGATVLVQNMDGTFRTSYKSHAKKK